MTAAAIRTRVTYLQMLRAPRRRLVDPNRNLQVHQIHAPTVALYRWLYRAVGSELHWFDRLLMTSEELQAILGDEQVDLFTLHLDGHPAGYCELDRRSGDEIELSYFGLFPQFLGRGLGKFFLEWTVCEAWSHHPQRLWLHTCDLDHPAALPNYLKAGFEIYRETWVNQTIIDDAAAFQTDTEVPNEGVFTVSYPRAE